jgi:hypothetical protein
MTFSFQWLGIWIEVLSLVLCLFIYLLREDHVFHMNEEVFESKYSLGRGEGQSWAAEGRSSHPWPPVVSPLLTRSQASHSCATNLRVS